MAELSFDFDKNISLLDCVLNVKESFDMIKREMEINSKRVVLYYIDGFITAATMQKLMMHLTTIKDFGSNREGDLEKFIKTSVPAVEVDACYSLDKMVTMVLSGCTLMLAEGLGNGGIIIDARTYPARTTEEPENDKVMRGARDGFVETLLFNIAMVRRRIRNPNLIVEYHCIGEQSKTDVSLIYIKGKADNDYVKKLSQKLDSIKTDALPLGHQSLIECLIKKKWYNPFPKVRCTERPDAACASVLEGSVIIICDTSPEALILPTSIFDFLQETDDFYFPPFTGTYLRLVRQLVFIGSVFLTPVWYLLVLNANILPRWISFIVPDNYGNIPLLAQLLIIEIVLSGLKLASLNTPSVMSNSFSVVGGLLLGDFAVQIGWFSPDVIFYMAIESIAGFTQSNYELGYAFKFMRILCLILISFLNFYGLILGTLIMLILIATNSTVLNDKSYLSPLIPFNAKKLKSLLFRVKKK